MEGFNDEWGRPGPAGCVGGRAEQLLKLKVQSELAGGLLFLPANGFFVFFVLFCCIAMAAGSERVEAISRKERKGRRNLDSKRNVKRGAE